MKRLALIALLALMAVPSSAKDRRYRVLVFSKTTGFRHDSIPAGIDAVKKLGQENGFDVDVSEDASLFTKVRLAQYKALIFMNTTGDLFDDGQKAALMDYMARGGGFVGVHAATDTEHNWPWYKEMIGAEFKRHPAFQKATIRIEDRKDVSTRMLPAAWERSDEWYEFTASPRKKVHVLFSVDESTYQGGEMGKDHPFAWRRNIGKGRVWYTGCGHAKEAFAEPLMLAHLLGGIQWAAKAR